MSETAGVHVTATEENGTDNHATGKLVKTEETSLRETSAAAMNRATEDSAAIRSGARGSGTGARQLGKRAPRRAEMPVHETSEERGAALRTGARTEGSAAGADARRRQSGGSRSRRRRTAEQLIVSQSRSLTRTERSPVRRRPADSATTPPTK